MKRNESKLVTMLIVCLTLLASMGFAQGTPPNTAQEKDVLGNTDRVTHRMLFCMNTH